MTRLADWLERSAWRLRSADFGALFEHATRASERFVVMEIIASGTPDVVLDRRWQICLDLPPHSHVLEAVEDAHAGRRLVRYAALDWRASRLALDDPRAVTRAATWGVQLVRVCELLASSVRVDVRGWLASPIVKLDLEGEPRVLFGRAASDARLPPEVAAHWPRCDERGLVFVAGHLLRSLIAEGPSPLDPIFDRAIADEPAARFATLDELLAAFVAAGGRWAPREPRPRKVWSCVDAALGYLALGRRADAFHWFAAAVAQDGLARRTSRGRKAASSQTYLLQACRDEVGVIALPEPEPSLGAASAPAESPAEPSDDAAELARGRSLLRLGRFVEARDVFARASAHGPHILEAMLLRREVDRVLAHVRAVAGSASPQSLELPAQLGAVRDLLAGGRNHEAIETLQSAAYDRDAPAQMLRASLLSFERRYAEAVTAYDHVLTLGAPGQHRAVLGKADMLLALDQPEAALALFTRVHAEHPALIDALEGRARALDQLGRNAEAEVVFARYIALTGQRSDLRVRSR